MATANVKTRFTFTFRGHEQAWRGDRSNVLVRSFLAGLRAHDASAQLGFVLKTGTSDMNVVAPVWKCPIVAYGPGDSSLDHTPNEHLQLDEYWKAVNVLEQTLTAFAVYPHKGGHHDINDPVLTLWSPALPDDKPISAASSPAPQKYRSPPRNDRRGCFHSPRAGCCRSSRPPTRLTATAACR